MQGISALHVGSFSIPQSDLNEPHSVATPSQFKAWDLFSDLLTTNEKWKTIQKTYYMPKERMEGNLRRKLLSDRKSKKSIHL